MAKFLFYFQYLSKNTKTNSMRLYSRLQYLLDKHSFHTYRRRRESCTHTFLPLNYNSSMRLLGFLSNLVLFQSHAVKFLLPEICLAVKLVPLNENNIEKY